MTFEAIVSDIQTGGEVVTNKAVTTYNYQKTPTSPVESGSNESNENSIDGFDTTIETSKHTSAESVQVGGTFSYTVTMTNNGQLPAENVIITDILPTALTVQNVNVNGTAVNGDLAQGIPIGALGVGETFTIVITVLVTSRISEPFINELEAQLFFRPDPNMPPSEQTEIIVDTGKIGRDPSKPYEGVITMSSKIEMTKYTSKNQVAVGEIVDYFVDMENIGNVDANNVTFVDLLNGSLEFIEGSVTINGVIKPNESILSGVDLGTLQPNQKLTIGFKAEVIDNGVITNQALVDYTFKSGDIDKAGRDKSNINTINSSDTKLTVKKQADMEFVVLDDVISYTITVENTTQSTATNILLTDHFPRYLKLVEGSFSINGMVVNRVNLDRGVNLGDIEIGETITVKYQAKVVGSACSGMVENGAELSYSYILPDGSVGRETLEPEGDAISMVEMGMSNFKQFSIESYLQIPEAKPDVESINIATGTIDIKNCHVITTPINTSMENQRITGYKLVVHGILNLVIEYTALEARQGVHSAHYTIPFSTFVVLPQDYMVGSKLDVEGIVEDIYYNSIDIRNFFQNTTAMINVKILMC